MKHFLRSIGGGLAGLLSFGGRDGRLRFWPYAALVFFIAQLASMVPVSAAIGPVLREALEHPERSRVESGLGDYSIMLGREGALAPLLKQAAAFNALVTGTAILLLAAAVVRRLHDRDLRGYWGLLPLPFLALGFLLIPRMIAGMSRTGEPDLSWLGGIVANNLAYLGALGCLIYLLAGPGTPGANRFGPPPA